MSDLSSGSPQATACSPFYPFSMPDDSRAPASRPAETERTTELYGRGELAVVNPVELGRSIVLTVALPAFTVGCLVGMLL